VLCKHFRSPTITNPILISISPAYTQPVLVTSISPAYTQPVLVTSISPAYTQPVLVTAISSRLFCGQLATTHVT